MLDYRDPLFSIIVFLLLVAITILIANFLTSFKERKKIKELEEFIDKFDFLNDKEIESIFSNNISINALILLAIAFEKEGNYEKSLNIYKVLLQNIETNEKYTILQNMAEVYFKAGFLHKAKESLLNILKSYPRNKKALKLLFIVDDKLKDYDEMDNIIEILDELEENTMKEKAYLYFNKAKFENNKDLIKKLALKYPVLKRDFINYLLLTDSLSIFEYISEKDIYKMIDLFWNIDYLPLKNEALKQIQAAKKEIIFEKEAPLFEIEVLKYTPKNLADLEFEYICTNCKHLTPFYEDRCPHCKELFSLEVEVRIVKN